MDLKDYSSRALKGARCYWKYLENNNKGLIIYDVTDIAFEYSLNNQVTLILTISETKPIKFTDSLFVIINNKNFFSNELNILSISADGLKLTIKPIPETLNFLKSLKPSQIKIASDLKFLVQRIGEWYKTNSADI